MNSNTNTTDADTQSSNQPKQERSVGQSVRQSGPGSFLRNGKWLKSQNKKGQWVSQAKRTSFSPQTGDVVQEKYGLLTVKDF